MLKEPETNLAVVLLGELKKLFGRKHEESFAKILAQSPNSPGRTFPGKKRQPFPSAFHFVWGAGAANRRKRQRRKAGGKTSHVTQKGGAKRRCTDGKFAPPSETTFPLAVRTLNIKGYKKGPRANQKICQFSAFTVFGRRWMGRGARAVSCVPYENV